MTGLEHTLIAVGIMAVTYYTGYHFGKMKGISATLDYMQSIGAIELEYEDDNDELN